MKIVIAGASGFVGSHLSDSFSAKDFEVIKLRRDDIKDTDNLVQILNNADVVINLSGANIINRWTEEYKNLLYSSRIGTTKQLVKAMNKVKNKPKLFISTSAVGIYSNKRVYSEEDYEYGEDFLANLCKEWESEALQASNLGIRTVIFRFGIVLGKDGGALQKMLTPFKLGLGGTIGNGEQAFSFIHIDDLTNAYNFAIENQVLSGVYNMTAPIPTTNKELTKTLGEILHRPTILPVPEFVLNLIFSEGAKVLTDGQSVIPKKLQESGFQFQFNSIKEALTDIIK